MTNNQPIFQSIFGEQWDVLPPVMKKHYAVRAGSDDAVKVEGALDVKASWMVRLAGKLFHILVPCSGKDVPVTVTFCTSPNTQDFHFDRVFHFPDRKPYHFRSTMQPVGGNEVIEFMRLGFGWRCAFHWDGAKVSMSHRGYVWRIFGMNLPIPLAWLIGKGYAEEHPISDDSFSMWTHTNHPLFGETFRYEGVFKVMVDDK